MTDWKAYRKKHRARLLANEQRYRERHRERIRRRVRPHYRRHNLRRYGLTLEGYAWLVKKQRSRCAICGIKVSRLHVDHNHETDEVRGLLCPKCNTVLGYMSDNPFRLRRAADYLESARPRRTK
jgi:hypothetical protein